MWFFSQLPNPLNCGVGGLVGPRITPPPPAGGPRPREDLRNGALRPGRPLGASPPQGSLGHRYPLPAVPSSLAWVGGGALATRPQLPSVSYSCHQLVKTKISAFLHFFIFLFIHLFIYFILIIFPFFGGLRLFFILFFARGKVAPPRIRNLGSILERCNTCSPLLLYAIYPRHSSLVYAVTSCPSTHGGVHSQATAPDPANIQHTFPPIPSLMTLPRTPLYSRTHNSLYSRPG